MVGRDLMFRLAGSAAICLAALAAPLTGPERGAVLTAFGLGIGLAAVLPGYERDASRIVGPAVLMLAIGPATELWIMVDLLALVVVGLASFDRDGMSRAVPALGLPVITLAFRTGQPPTGPALGAWLAAVVITLILGTRRPGSDPVAWSGPRLPPDQELWRRSVGTLVAVTALTPVALLAAAFSAQHLPDLGSARPRAGLGEGEASAPHPGLSGGLDTGQPLELSDEIVLRVRSDPQHQLFWRGLTYDRWDGRRWSRTATEQAVTWTEQGIVLPDRDDAGSSADLGLLEPITVRQDFELSRAGLDVILAAWHPTTLWASPGTGRWGDDGSIRLDRSLGTGARWTVESSIVPVTADQLRMADPLVIGVEPELARYATEDNVPVEVAALARSITIDAPTTYDKVRAIEAWMERKITYTRDIEPLPAGSDAVHHLLIVTGKGYCEQIGSALVVMLRSLGVPARLVVGYVPSEYDSSTGQWISRGVDAHAWAEVWFPGIGWHPFDPTAGVPLAADVGDPPIGWPVAAMVVSVSAGLVALAGLGWLHRHRSGLGPVTEQGDPDVEALGPLMADYQWCGTRLGLSWSPAMTIGERAATLITAGVDPGVVQAAVTALERLWYAGPRPGTGLARVEVDRARKAVDALVQATEVAERGRSEDGVTPDGADRSGIG
jgi:transglutaminase-like putative cysteine protease